MFATVRRTLTATFALLLLIGLQGRSANAEGVSDKAGFFSGEAVQKAAAGIDAIKQLYNRQLMVATFRAPPPSRLEAIQSTDKEKRNSAFYSWAQLERSNENIKDIFILICKEPPHVQLALGQDALDKFLTTEDRDALRDLLVKQFRDKKYDQGLLDAVGFVRGKLDEKVFRAFPGPVANKVKDYASFFSPAVVEKADDEIRKISRNLKRPIAVDTFKQPPAALAKQVASASADEKKRIYGNWQNERMRASRFEGIYLLVTREPSRLEVGVSSELEKRAFKPADRVKLQSLLLEKFRAKQFDEGLTEGLNLIRDTVQANLGIKSETASGGTEAKATRSENSGAVKADGIGKKELAFSGTTQGQPPGPASKTDEAKKMIAEVGGKVKETVSKEVEAGPNWMWIVYLVIGLLVLWIVIGIFRALFGSKKQTPVYYPPQQGPPPSGTYSTPQASRPTQPPAQPGYGPPPQQMPAPGGYYPPPPAGGGGGGGFMSGVLGGMFGAAAGNWIYDSLSGRSRSGGWGSPAYGGQPHYTTPSNTRDDTSGNVSTGGGDFGDQPADVSSSGGDFGDSAASEADTGGGDFGDASEGSQDTGGDFDDSGAQEDTGGDFGDSGGQEDTGGDFDSGGGDFGGSDSGADSGGGDF